jgi:ABC-type metal ion transport system substrate-binding protein
MQILNMKAPKGHEKELMRGFLKMLEGGLIKCKDGKTGKPVSRADIEKAIKKVKVGAKVSFTTRMSDKAAKKWNKEMKSIKAA